MPKKSAKKPSKKATRSSGESAKKATAKKANQKPAKKNAAKKKTTIPKLKSPPPAQYVNKVLAQLKTDYADAECALLFETPYQLLIATILSAQCTDERVNIVTKELFKIYPTATDIAALPVEKIEELIKTTGFFRNKAKNIKACSESLLNDHGGKVPQDLEALVKLPGVGRKTANVVLGTAFGIPTGVVVDTHVGRLSIRLGMTDKTDAVKAEADLMTILPKDEWIMYSHRLIHHGRKVCNARKPKCSACQMGGYCPKIAVDVSA
jgi:endonuclease-3